MSRTLRRLIPSPAMLVALVALVVSLGSSGYASQIVPTLTGDNIINNSVTGKDIRDLTRKDIRKRSLRGRKFELNSVGDRAIKESRLETVPSADSAGGLDLWAIVRPDGVLEPGRAMVAGNPPSAARTSAGNPPVTSRTSPGNYLVTFDRNVSNCSYQATIGSPNSSYPLWGEIIVARSGNNALKVRTAPLGAKTEADRPFQIAVIC